MVEVAAALANWNGAAHVDRCLDCLGAQTYPVRHIAVVDNGSTDGSRERIAARFPAVRLLANARNEGYAAGYNQAIAAAGGDAVLILNTDVFLEPDFVERVLAGLERHPGAAAVTGRLYEQATGRLISGGFYLRRQIRIQPAPLAEEDLEVFGVTGAAALFRRDALEDLKVDGQCFDEAYFAYGEDIDLAWRARLLGWSAWSVPDARGEHVGSGSLGGRLRFLDKPASFQRHTLKNRYLTVMKNATPGMALRLAPVLVASELLLWPYLLLTRTRSFPALVRAPIDALRLLGRARRWRAQIQGRRHPGAARIPRFVRGL
ncbi:MAG: glycosyltransferase family 2 protein [Gemmatimonadota bacterium]